MRFVFGCPRVCVQRLSSISRYFVQLFVWALLFSVFFIAVISCAPAPQASLQPNEGAQQAADTTVDNSLTMVAAAAIPQTLILTDTLLIVPIGSTQSTISANTTSDFILGPRSAFPELPPNSIVLLQDTVVPADVPSVGQIYLNQTWNLPSDQVVVITKEDKLVVGATDGDETVGYSVEPRFAGKVTYTSPTDIKLSPVELNNTWELRIEALKGIGGSADCIDWIQCACMWCDCCELPSPMEFSMPEFGDPVPGIVDPMPEPTSPVPGIVDPMPEPTSPVPGFVDPIPEIIDPVPEFGEQPPIFEKPDKYFVEPY